MTIIKETHTVKRLVCKDQVYHCYQAKMIFIKTHKEMMIHDFVSEMGILNVYIVYVCVCIFKEHPFGFG